MKVKRYRAENMSQAIAMVKKGLGPDAVILSTKTVRVGIKGVRKPLLEVSATVMPVQANDNKKLINTNPKQALASYKIVERTLSDTKTLNLMDKSAKSAKQAEQSVKETNTEIEDLQQEVMELRNRRQNSTESDPAHDLLSEVHSMAQEIAELREMMQDGRSIKIQGGEPKPFTEDWLAPELTQMNGKSRDSYLLTEIKNIKNLMVRITDSTLGEVGDAVRIELEMMKNMLEGLLDDERGGMAIPADANTEKLLKRLLDSGVPAKKAWSLLGEVASGLDEKNLSFAEYGEEVLAEAIMDCVPVIKPINGNGDKGRAIALIGPTGVGKTTTIAKLAAQQVFDENKQIAIITLDTFRVGAVDQLQTYAKILGVPCDVAYNEIEFANLIQVHSDKDLILIDTVGISQKDEEMMRGMCKVFKDIRSIETHLIVSATTRESDLRDILNRFTKVPIRSLIISKLDETVSFGSLLGLYEEANLPLSYFTTGQKVPEDIELASPERVADMILRISAQGEGN